MSKYHPLRDYLLTLKTDTWTVSFIELEEILGFSLPKSAYQYPAWWANETVGSHSHSLSWMSIGWKIDNVNIAKRTVCFSKSEDFLPNQVSVLNKEVLSQGLYAWDKEQIISTAFKIHWKPLGPVTKKDAKLSFPSAPKKAGLYKFKIKTGNQFSFYVGEAKDLRRRFGNYKNAAPTQQTSFRLRNLFFDLIKAGSEISVSIVTDDAWVETDNGLQHLDLKSKTVRCLLESISIIEERAEGFICLNQAD